MAISYFSDERATSSAGIRLQETLALSALLSAPVLTYGTSSTGKTLLGLQSRFVDTVSVLKLSGVCPQNRTAVKRPNRLDPPSRKIKYSPQCTAVQYMRKREFWTCTYHTYLSEGVYPLLYQHSTHSRRCYNPSGRPPTCRYVLAVLWTGTASTRSQGFGRQYCSRCQYRAVFRTPVRFFLLFLSPRIPSNVFARLSPSPSY